MNLKNEITVGIPFYNEVDINHLGLCIESIINQSIKPKIIHLIQDGEISSLLKEKIDYYIDKYPDLFLLLELPKKGLPYALNQSIKITKTMYYARMDADDIAISDRFEIQVKYLEENLDIDILGSWAYEFDENYHDKSLYVNETPNNYEKIKEYVHYRNPLIHPSIIFRMSVFNKLGYYNEKMITDQDLELWGRALSYDIGITNIQKPLIFLRIQNRLLRRSKLSAIKRQISIRYSFKTLSIKLNVLKLMSIILRFMPYSISKWAYKNLRSLQYESKRDKST